MKTLPVILVAIDGSDPCMDAIKYISRILSPNQINIGLFHVRTEAPEAVSDLGRDDGATAYSLVVIGRKGHGTLPDFMLGSIAAKLAESMTHVPLVIVGGQPETTKLELAHMSLTVVNVHLETRAIRQQAEKLLSLISAIKSPLVLAGDFNCPADDPALSPIRTRVVNTCSAVDVTGSREADAVGTIVLHNIPIDHIFFDPQYLSVSDAGLLPESHPRVSDHIGYHAESWVGSSGISTLRKPRTMVEIACSSVRPRVSKGRSMRCNTPAATLP